MLPLKWKLLNSTFQWSCLLDSFWIFSPSWNFSKLVIFAVWHLESKHDIACFCRETGEVIGAKARKNMPVIEVYWGVISQAELWYFLFITLRLCRQSPKNVRSQGGLSNVRASDCNTIDFPTSFELELAAVARITSPCPRSAAKRFFGTALRICGL